MDVSLDLRVTGGRHPPDGVTIRPLAASDLDALVRLETDVFAHDRLDRRAFRRAIASPTIVALGAARPHGELLGYVLVEIRRGARLARLSSVGVALSGRGRGLGRRLVAAVEAASREAECDRLRLELRADNVAARRLYEAGGYRLVGEVAEYYEDGGTALKFERRLGPPDLSEPEARRP